jgi:arylsulfatase A-like enzyme
MKALRTPSRRWLRILQLSLGLGFLAGGFEMIQVVSMLKLGLSLAETAALGLVAMGCGALVALGVALVPGLAVQLACKKLLDSRAYAIGLAGTALLLAGFFLWHTAAQMHGDGRSIWAVLAMAACPIGVAGVVYFNAGYWARREEIGAESKLGWTGVSLLMGLGMVGIAALIADGREYGSSKALEGDPNVLVISIDTLRRDHVSIYGHGRAQTPNIDSLADGGVVFLDAVVPTPETAPSHASLFTNLPPQSHEVLSNADVLALGHTTLAERLEDEGYATGAFLSSYAVNSRTNLDQGFQAYDDDFAPVRGLSQILLVQKLLAGIMATRQPQLVPWLLERDGDATVDLAEGWIEDRGEAPWFVWVHLFEPHAPYEAPDASLDHRQILRDPARDYSIEDVAELSRLYALEVEDADRLVGRLLDLLDERGLRERTLIVLVSDHGEQLGEHEVYFEHHGLWDESVRIPMLMWLPGYKPYVSEVPQQVRIMDVAPTLLKYIKLDPLKNRYGVDLRRFSNGLEKKSPVVDLLGRKTSALDAGCLLGLRTASSVAPREGQDPAEVADAEGRVKFVHDVDLGDELFFDLLADPAELTNLAASQPSAVAAARQRTDSFLRKGCGGRAVDASTQAALEALGYVDR